MGHCSVVMSTPFQDDPEGGDNELDSARGAEADWKKPGAGIKVSFPKRMK